MHTRTEGGEDGVRPINVHECESTLTRWLQAQRLEAESSGDEECEALYVLEEMLDWAKAYLPDGVGCVPFDACNFYVFFDSIGACIYFDVYQDAYIYIIHNYIRTHTV
jgi:hypothetical protein